MQRTEKKQRVSAVRVRTDDVTTTYRGYMKADGKVVVTDIECIDEDLPLVELESLPN